jgi:hypothetical protein
MLSALRPPALLPGELAWIAAGVATSLAALVPK